MADSKNAKETTEITDKVELLIGPRRSAMAKAVGIRPLTASAMRSAMSVITQQHGAEIIKEFRPRHKMKTLSAADEATTVFKVRLGMEAASVLSQTAPPSIAVEVDSLLGYGSVGPSAVLQAIMNGGRSGVSFGGVTATQVQIQVIGKDDKPVANANVTIESAGFPQEGVTDKNGMVTLPVFSAGGAGQVRSIFVRPTEGHWNRILQTPSLSTGTVNLIKLHPISEMLPDFPKNAEYGWGQQLMGLERLPDEYTGKGVRIAIIDSGADTSHPALKHIQSGLDLTNGNDTKSWSKDVIGHGTHCAGVITGNSPETEAIRGFAPEAEIHIFKVFPGGQFSSLLDALATCIELGIDVVNMSLGSGDASDVVEQQIEEAIQNGVACVVAAGNSGGPVQYPARSPNVLAVAALGMLNQFPSDTWEATTVMPGHVSGRFFSPSFTCFGPEIGVAAPGVGIVSSVPGGFDPQSGTSMAAPHVTGLAALLLAHHPLFKSSLRERNASRVSGLFSLIRSIAQPLQMSSDRAGAGMPGLDAVVAAFDAARAEATEGQGQRLNAASAGPGAFFPAAAFAPQFGNPMGGLGQFGPMSITPSPLGGFVAMQRGGNGHMLGGSPFQMNAGFTNGAVGGFLR